MPAYLNAYTVTSCLGHGLGATLQHLKENRTGLTPCDFEDAELSCLIGRVDGVESHAFPAGFEAHDSRLGRLMHLALQQDNLETTLRAAIATHGAERVALIVGTSTSGILNTEHAYMRRDADGQLPDDYSHIHSHDHYACNRFLHDYLGLQGISYVISTACSSSAKILADGMQILDAGHADAVIAVGIDTLCLTTLYGFNSLELLSPDGCRPCDAQRNGIAIGEGVGIALLEAAPNGDAPVRLKGYGESSDGYHMSSPHPEGKGAIAAMQNALNHADIAAKSIDYINMHGTGTPANDAAESKAIYAVFGGTTPCSSTKGATGHILGAAGIVEAIIGALCITQNLMPACIGMTTQDPAIHTAVISKAQTAQVRRMLSNSIGFGGNNCSLILEAV